MFKGIATAMITPFDNGKIAFGKLKELIDMQIEKGIAAIVLSGSTGESATLSDSEKMELFKKGVEFTDKRVPLIAGTGTNATDKVLELSEFASEAGADGFLVCNPYYNKSNDEGIYTHYKKLSDNVDKPIIVYNIPSRTGKNMSLSLELALCEIKNVKAFKEANSDITQIIQFFAKKPKDISVYSGNDEQTFTFLSLGGSGTISTCSNIAPEIMCEITNAYFSSDIEKARQKQFDMLELFSAMFIDCNPMPIKTAMNMAGMNVGELRLPLVEIQGEDRQYIQRVLEKYSLLKRS